MCFLIASDGSAAFIAFNNGACSFAHIVYGKDEGRRVIEESTVEKSVAEATLADIESSALKPVGEEPTATAEGGSVEMLIQAALHLKHLVGNDPLRVGFVGTEGQLYHLSASEKGGLTSALISYCDLKGEHHAIIFTCKQAARTHIVKDMEWLDAPTRKSILEFVRTSDLVDFSRRRDAHITGRIAAAFNVAFMAQAEAAKQPAN